MYYVEKEFIKAHQNVNIPYYNHSYDREVRDVFCKKCKARIGEQAKYEIQDEYYFHSEKDHYTHCPYCGHKFKKGKQK